MGDYMDKFVNININKIKEMNDNSCDITHKIITINDKKVGIVFLESTASDDKISNFLGKSLSQDVKNKKKTLFENIFDYLENTIPNSKIKIVETYDDIFFHLSAGFTIILVDGTNKALAIETNPWRLFLRLSIIRTLALDLLISPRDVSISPSFEKYFPTSSFSTKAETLVIRFFTMLTT